MKKEFGILKRGCMWRLFSVFFIFSMCCLPTNSFGAPEKLQVVVSILPQKFFVEKIGGDKVNVSVMVAPGANPATYEPKPRQMAKLSMAKIYFAIGVPFERVWLKRFKDTNPGLSIILTQEGIKLLPMSRSLPSDRRAGPASTGIMDPHIWLSPPLVMLQARNILDALVNAQPESMSYFQDRYASFINLVVSTDIKIMNIFNPGHKRIQQDAFMVYHPCWGYFAKAYGLKQIPIEEEGKEPKPAHLVKLVRMARESNISAILIQPQYSQKSAVAIADSIGATLIPADPLAYEWDKNLLFVARKIKENLR